MSLDKLLGNEQLKSKLAPALREDRLSHAYILAGPEGSGRRTLARLLAAAMECTAGALRPCCVCPQCRKALSGTHPDVVTVDDTEHKGVSVAVVREARGDLFIRPNEGRRKVYLFPRAMDMNAAGQNSLLKVLEEPPDYGAFLLVTDAPQKLLPTIRSRCVELRLAPLSREVCIAALQSAFPGKDPSALEAAYLRSGGYYGQAAKLLCEGSGLRPQTLRFAEVCAQRDRLGLTELLAPMERFSRDQLQPILTEWLSLVSEALSVRGGLPAQTPEAEQLAGARTGQDLARAVADLQRMLTLLQGNVSPGAICGALQIYLR